MKRTAGNLSSEILKRGAQIPEMSQYATSIWAYSSMEWATSTFLEVSSRSLSLGLYTGEGVAH